MIINQDNLTEKQKKMFQLFLENHNIPYVSKEHGEHLYHKATLVEYEKAADAMNGYNSVILNLIALASCGQNAPDFTFTAQVVEEEGEHKGSFKQFARYNLEWNDEGADRGMNTMDSGLYSLLSFDTTTLFVESEYEAENEYDQYVRLF